MCHFSPVYFLAFALCLIACSAKGAVAANSVEGKAAANIVGVAKQEVEATKKSTKEVYDKAQSYIANTQSKLEKVEECEKQTQRALLQAEVSEEENQDDANLGDNTDRDSNKVCTFILNAKEVLEKNVASLGEFMKEAKTLDGECETELSLINEAAEDYKDINNNVSYLKNKAGILTTKFADILRNMNAVESTAANMEQSVTNSQLGNLHVSAIVAVSKIQTMIKEADINLKKTQNKKNEVNDIVREMLKVCTTATTESNKVIEELCDSAKEALNSATGAVDKAKKAKEEIEKQKEPADSALTNVQQATDVSTAQQEVNNAQKCVLNGKTSEDQLLSALQTAKNALKKAKALNQELVTALSTTTTAPNTQQTTEAKKSDPLVADSTGTDQKDATTQPMITDKEQPTSKDSPDQIDNSTDKLKDTLIKGAQNVPTTALTGGKAPAPGAKNDSAMTVSVPLLVALIASAVLQ